MEEREFEAAEELFPAWGPEPFLPAAADLVITGIGELATLAGASTEPKRGKALQEIGIIRGAAVVIGNGRILAVGPESDVLPQANVGEQTRVLDAAGRAVIPGLVDCHTHLPFAGSREAEFAMRLQGATYLEILAAGGGILSTVQATRATDAAALTLLVRERLDQMLLCGTTTAEAKSGYGLDTEHEIKQLLAIAAAAHCVELLPTFLGAHTVPKGIDRNRYVRKLIQEMLPQLAAANAADAQAGREPLAVFCDAFCEAGAFTPDETRQILWAGKALGLRPKLHADQLSDSGGAALAAELGAISADHLEHANDQGLAAMAAAGTIGVLLPGAAFCLGQPQANARRMIDAGVPVALATDFNPGSSPIYSLPLSMAIACTQMRLSPAEALAAATINAAHAIGRADRIGSLEPGKQADLVILAAPNHQHIPYRPGASLVHTVVKRGRVVVEDGRRLRD